MNRCVNIELAVEANSRNADRAILKRLTVGMASLFFATTMSVAQTWPTKPIKYILPFPPGGAADLASRPVLEKLREALGEPVVFNYLPGAGGTIGAARLAKADPDGYTIGMGNSGTQTVSPNLLAKPPYDPLRDFTPVAVLNEYSLVLVVNSSLPVRNVKEFIAFAQSKPNNVSYASAGIGSSQHLAGLLLASQANLKLEHVPYKGSGPALTDVIAGHVDSMFIAISELKPFLQGAKVRAVGISGRTADSLLPGVPPIRDTLPNYEVVGFMGIFGPANMPPDIVKRLNGEISKIMSRPEMARHLEDMGMRAVESTPEELGERVRKDLARWKDVIRAEKIQLE